MTCWPNNACSSRKQVQSKVRKSMVHQKWWETSLLLFCLGKLAQHQLCIVQAHLTPLPRRLPRTIWMELQRFSKELTASLECDNLVLKMPSHWSVNMFYLANTKRHTLHLSYSSSSKLKLMPRQAQTDSHQAILVQHHEKPLSINVRLKWTLCCLSEFAELRKIITTAKRNRQSLKSENVWSMRESNSAKDTSAWKRLRL